MGPRVGVVVRGFTFFLEFQVQLTGPTLGLRVYESF